MLFRYRPRQTWMPFAMPRPMTEQERDRERAAVYNASQEVAYYHRPTGDQGERHGRLSHALANLLQEIVNVCPPGPERSTAISRAREAKMWASAAIALEGR